MPHRATDLQSLSEPGTLMSQRHFTSLSFDQRELTAFKRALLRERPYHERVSMALTFRLATASNSRLNLFSVLDEIDYQEGITSTSRTKEATKFRKAPLHGLWHKHFFSPRHLIKNIEVRWNLSEDGNKDLDSAISAIAKEYGEDASIWPDILTHRLIVEGFEERAVRGLTGDWIIYGKHQGKNFYLDLATHEEGLHPECLLQKLKDGCYAEFPFVFDGISEALVRVPES